MFRISGLFLFSFILVMLLVLISFIDNMFFGGLTRPSNIPYTANQLPLPNQTAPSQPVPTPLPQVAPFQDIEAKRIARVRSELWQASKLLADASIHADQAVVQSDAWTRDIEPLLKNDEGRLIRAHKDLVARMAFIVEDKRPVKQELTLVHDRIVDLTSKTDRVSRESAPADLDAQFMLDVTDLHRRAQDASQVWSEAVDRANAILSEAKRRPPDAVAATQPQQPVVTEQSAPVVTQPAPVVAQPQTKNDTSKAIASLPPAPRDSLADAVQSVVDQAKIAALAEEQKQREQRAQEQAEKQLAADLAAQLAAEARAKLVKEARTDEVQRVLQPFLTVRALQPRLAGASVQMSKTVNEAPMSFTALKNMGALNESLRGLEVLARVGSHRDMNGPKWQYNPSPRSWSQETQEELKHAQELLRRLGPTLVSERLLSD